MATPITNVQLWNEVRKRNPQFASHTSEGTTELFTERGYTTLTQSGMQTVNEFWQLAMPFYVNIVNISHAEDRLENEGFGEYSEIPWGGYIQRMSVNSIKPVSPAYRNLSNGSSPDPFVVRKPVTNNRFFPYNFDYQSVVTMPDQWENKRIFTSEYGMSEFLAGVFQGLENGYILQKYLNKLETLNAAINGATNPLKDSQKVEVTLSANPTSTELVNLQRRYMQVIQQMVISPQTGAFNALGFESTQDKSRLKLLVRPGYSIDLALDVVRGSYNADTLNLGVDLITVPHFGGLKPFKEAAYTTPLYPVYDTLGTRTGWNTKADGTGTAVADSEVFWKDPNENVVAILADKGVIFEARQNPYQVEPIRNPRGLYTNYWASSPNNAIVYDPLYNFVVFTAVAPTPGT